LSTRKAGEYGILEHASSALALPAAGVAGADFAAAWHGAFD
jgi:hypothetical protein